ncbi:MAG: hypothetical protein H7305_09730 [Gemmatimonadaceae bacterium]|nr:hypothetical protein [Gemmatimonadaceae bacterium]
MDSRPLLAAIASIVTLTIAASPLAAQQVPVAPEPLARVVASYDLRNGPRELDFPRSVTVADSAGTILARVNVAGSARSIPMTVTVIESDLVLQGLTSAGVLTLVLDRQNEGGETRLATGSWTLGRTQGLLRAKNAR